MLQKGRILLTLVGLLCAAIIFTDCVASLSAPAKLSGIPHSLAAVGLPALGLMPPPGLAALGELPPLPAAGISPLGAAPPPTPSGRRIIGRERPDWLFEALQMRAAQGSGPIPDINLTPTATLSEELYPNSATYGELNRLVISSNGVDENHDGKFDAGVVADDFNLWLIRVDGAFATQLTNVPGDELYPRYDPGARLIAFSSDATGTFQIYTVEVLTGTIRQLTFSPGNKYQPTWSPDGTQLVFSGDNGGNRDLFIIPADGSALPVPIMTTPADETQPEWAVRGGGSNPILFTRSGAGGGSRIWRVGPGGANEEQVTTGGGNPAANDVDPTWRHNGQMIAFASDRLTDALDPTPNYNIYTVSPSGENGTTAVLRSNLDEADTRDNRYPTFNPGLSPREPVRIFFSSWRAGNQPDIWRFEVADPVPPELVDLPYVDAPRRFVPPGADITIHVEVFDRDSGVRTVVAEMKDPDSAEDDSQGIDHKQFIPISTSLQSGATGTVFLEIDCDTVGQTQLFDDGDPAHGDEVAGDGIFSGVWTTPPSPSDFIIDMHVEDNAGNTFEYDDIFGFTTQQFQPVTNVLLVDDYCEGQAFIAAASGANNDMPTAYPVESYYTSNPGAGGAVNTIRDAPYGTGEPYDIWRVICRGEITITDLIYYLPTKETQLTVPDLTGTREVLIADRAVIWAAPHAGDVWVGDGSVVSATVQATLATFLDRGGRLMISGQDIGFALTLDGTSTNSFFSNYLHAGYVRDDNNGQPNGAIIDDFINGADGDPVVDHPFYFWPPKDVEDPNDDCAIGWWLTNNILYPQDCAFFTTWPDVIVAGPGAVVTHAYDNGNTAGIRFEMPGGGYRVAYYAWGFEQTHKVWGGDGPHCLNYRAKFMHNTLCWLRTGGFQGRVLSISDGNQPINNPPPIVRVFSGGTMIAAVECEEDGRYVVGGIPPGSYSLSAFRPGFEIDHSTARTTHGGLNYPVVDFAITRAEPGAVRGTVTSLATGETLATVRVCVYEAVPETPEEENVPAQTPGYQRGALIGCTTTAADGTYAIGDIPPGEVIVVADGSGIGYGTAEALVTITSGNTHNVDLALEAAPGTIEVTVVDAGNAAVENATVEVLQDGAVVATGVTDANGEVSIQVQPGSYTVRATAPGFEPSATEAVTVAAAETAPVTLTLFSEPPGSLSGMISRALSGEAVAGVRVDLLANEVVIASTTSFAPAIDPGTGQRYNYRFENVPTGQIIVQPDPVGFTVTPARRIATVVSGKETTGVNFAISAIRTFPAGLQLISLPYDYPLDDPAELLGADPATFLMAAWEPTTNRYHYYQSAPADRFRLGTGYWLKLHEVHELAREGIEAGDVHELSLRAGTSGWNLVGGFFNDPLDFYALNVRDRNGVVHTMQQAMAAGLVRSPLFAYVLGSYTTSSVAEPYVGYWLNVGDDVTIIGDRRTDTLAADGAPSRPAIIAPEGGWLAPLVVSSGGVCDACTWIGCAPSATNDFDAGLDLLKPPPPGLDTVVYAASGDEGGMAVDVRAPAAGTTWSLKVMAPAGRPVRVDWPDLSGVPNDVRPVLVDPATGAQVYMRTSQGYEFTAREGARVLQVRLLGAEGVLSVSTPAARPVGGGAEISYTLSTDAEVEVSVLNIAGRVIDTVLAGEMQSAGTQRLVWDGMSAQGTRAPAGVYVIVVRARAANGQQTQAIGTMRLGR